MTRPEAIRIRITNREQKSDFNDPRVAFWAAAWRESESTDTSETITRSEARLCREFGANLRSHLLRELSAPLRTLDSQLFPGSYRDFERWMFRFKEMPREDYGYQFAEVFSRLMEQRQQVLRESASLRQVQERLAAAAGIMFSARVAGYASLNLDLSVGSFSQVAKAFEGDFDSFRVFLEAFVPVAFTEIFGNETADRLAFSVDLPESIERAFQVGSTVPEAQAEQPLAAQPELSGRGTARERAEWLWRLANGSLLVPVILALFVMWQGMRMLNETRAAQLEALKPILEHHLKLLEEDRHRLFGTDKPSAPPLQLPATGNK